MKTFFTSVLLLISLLATAQPYYNSPHSIEYDRNHQRYIVANNGGGNLLSVIPGNAPTLFASSLPSPTGCVIVGDTVYVCCNTNHLRAYNLTTGLLIFDISFGLVPHGMCLGPNGNIFIADFGANRITRYNIASHQFNTFRNLSYTPTSIVYDFIHQRLVVGTWNNNAFIIGVNLADSLLAFTKPTSLSNIHGLAMDADGNFYFTSDISGGEGIYFFDSALTNTPLQIIGFGSGTTHGHICFNTLTDTLAVTDISYDDIQYFGFPHPRPTNDYAALIVSDTQTICVLQNDSLAQNVPLVLQSFSPPQFGTATINNNCIDYIADSVGSDTIYYVVCSDDMPALCRTGTLFIANVDGTGNHAPIARDNIVSATQLIPTTVNVAFDDVDVDGDSICLTTLIGSASFSLDSVNCNNIIFLSDSFFLGNDTCWYVICDNGSPVLCDTALLVVTVLFNNALLPVAAFSISYTSCYAVTAINTSIGDTGTAVWLFSPQFGNSMTLYGDTAYYLSFNMWGFYGEVCLYISNQYGSDSLCQQYGLICESIEESTVKNILLYPNPASNILTIDMQNNNEEITRNYSSIEIINAVGKKQKSISKKGASAIVPINVSDLPSGIYLATIVSDKQERRMLGKFTVIK